MAERWHHQTRALTETVAALDEGVKRICVTAPAGAGKSAIACDLMTEIAKPRGWNVAAYTNRKMLLEQWCRVLDAANIPFGIRASGHPPAYLRQVQLCMVQSESAAVYESERRDLHEARLVIIDEVHLNKAATMQQLVADHEKLGAQTVGFTATPMDLGPMAIRLIIGAKTSECRACGAIVPCTTYAPDEPSAKGLHREATGEYSEADVRRRIMTPTIFGRVHDHLLRLNPDLLPTLLFAPGVAESIWFCEQFAAKGLRAAHLGGEEIWIDGERHAGTPELRAQIIKEHRDGEIAVLSNRFVLREGLDLPYVRHVVFATIFGGLQSFLQAGGRGMRAYLGKARCCVQDHGGNWHRHGSLNADRDWQLGDSNYVLSEMRDDALREHTIPDPIRCPKCGLVRVRGPVCFGCGYRHARGSRMVVELDGRLQKVEGYILRKKSRQKRHDTEHIWKQCYYRCRKAEKTFRQAEGLFVHENGYWPPRTLPLMPRDAYDWFREIQAVPAEALL